MAQTTQTRQIVARADEPQRAQSGWRADLWQWARYLYFLRVVLLACLFLILLPLAARAAGTGALLGGLFDLSWGDVFLVSLLVGLMVLNLIVITHLVLINGCERFELRRAHSQGKRVRTGEPDWRLLMVFALVAYLSLLLTHMASPNPEVEKAVPTVAGLLCAIAVSQATVLLYRWLVPSRLMGDRQSPTILEPFLLTGVAPWLRPLSDRLAGRDPQERLGRWLRRTFPPLAGWLDREHRIPPWLGRGFFKYRSQREGTVEYLYPGCIMALLLLVVWVAIYLAIWLLGNLSADFAARVPALAYGLILVMTLIWPLAFLVYILDRFRWPLLLFLLMWGWATSWSQVGDYYYPVTPQASRYLVPPGSVIGERDALIVVAANGGGIQSAAWTARVLTGLERRARDEFGEGFRGFGSSIRFISSVSGGSVGAMYVVNAYTEGGLPDRAALEAVVDQAATSSLSAVVWGMAYPDLVHTLLPLPFGGDRGGALESSWARADEGLRRGLSTWRPGVVKGWRPATAFNATIAETGERLLFATTDFERQGSKSFNTLAGYDLPIVTAARLSASFPYVTPAARASPEVPDRLSFHVVDGGYYDNYGMVTLVDWLDMALSDAKEAGRPVRRVLVLQIIGAPDVTGTLYRFADDAPADACPSPQLSTLARHDTSGWLYQLGAPLATMLAVRDTGQRAHNRTELDLLQRAWGAEGVTIEHATFQYHGADAPLSWHMTGGQRESIERYWDAYTRGCFMKDEAWTKVRSFLAATPEARYR